MLYAALWRALPGHPVAKALQVLVLLVVAVAFCFLWLFPRIAPHMPFNDNTISTQRARPALTAQPTPGEPA